jgi:glycosyltransferase involved in cell wall biosynthesis
MMEHANAVPYYSGRDTKKPALSTLQIGMGSLSEQAGGLTRFYHDLVRYLPRGGVAVRGLVDGSSASPTPQQVVREFASSTAPLPMRWLALRRELRRELTEGRPDLVAAHFAPYVFPALDMIRPLPLVVHFHGPWALESQFEGERQPKVWAKTCIERAVYRRGARLIVLSNYSRDILCLFYGAPAERIRVIPGGVDAGFFATDATRREARERLGWPQDRPIALTVRRLVRRMGLEDLVTAMDKVRKKVPDALLMVAGEGPLKGTLRGLVRSLRLENNVCFLGLIPARHRDLPMAYRAADLTVVPSVASEGFGLVVVESFAAGTPALVTPVGGLPEVARDLSPEMVLPAIGAGSLSDGLVAAFTGKLLLPDANAARTYAQARYGWPVIAVRIRDVYLEALL